MVSQFRTIRSIDILAVRPSADGTTWIVLAARAADPLHPWATYSALQSVDGETLELRHPVYCATLDCARSSYAARA